MHLVWGWQRTFCYERSPERSMTHREGSIKYKHTQMRHTQTRTGAFNTLTFKNIVNAPLQHTGSLYTLHVSYRDNCVGIHTRTAWVRSLWQGHLENVPLIRIMQWFTLLGKWVGADKWEHIFSFYISIRFNGEHGTSTLCTVWFGTHEASDIHFKRPCRLFCKLWNNDYRGLQSSSD